MLDRGVCALAAVAVGAYLAADRLDALLVHSALGTCVLLAAVSLILRCLRRRGAPGPAGQVRGAEQAARVERAARNGVGPADHPAPDGAGEPASFPRRG